MNLLLIIFFGILATAAIWIIGSPLLRATRRRKLLSATMPEDWNRILEKRFEVYAGLPVAVRDRLAGMMHVFIAEKRFEACGELDEITEEMRVLTAAQACLLLLGIKKHRYFPRLKSILIYPDAYQDRRRRTFDLNTELGDTRLGESWDSGSVVLSWESVKKGAVNEDDGMNVVFHEFAHQLDQIDSSADGAPPLPNFGDYREWAEVFGREFKALVKAAESGRGDPLLDTYGAQNPAEFFAVATEAFFEMPEQMKREHAELYQQLTNYFGIDPAENRWSPTIGS